MKTIKVFTDGSCYWKTRVGGYGVYIESDGREFKEGYTNTTVNRMETMAVLRTLDEVNVDSDVLVYSDSEYVVKTIAEGKLKKYEKLRFHKVANADLWIKISAVLKLKNINLVMRHVDGHQDNLDNPIVFGNWVADELADYKNHKNYKKDLPV